MFEKDASKDKTEQIMCGIVDSVERKLNDESKHNVMSSTGDAIILVGSLIVKLSLDGSGDSKDAILLKVMHAKTGALIDQERIRFYAAMGCTDKGEQIYIWQYEDSVDWYHAPTEQQKDLLATEIAAYINCFMSIR